MEMRCFQSAERGKHLLWNEAFVRASHSGPPSWPTTTDPAVGAGDDGAAAAIFVPQLPNIMMVPSLQTEQAGSAQEAQRAEKGRGGVGYMVQRHSRCLHLSEKLTRTTDNQQPVVLWSCRACVEGGTSPYYSSARCGHWLGIRSLILEPSSPKPAVFFSTALVGETALLPRRHLWGRLPW